MKSCGNVGARKWHMYLPIGYVPEEHRLRVKPRRLLLKALQTRNSSPVVVVNSMCVTSLLKLWNSGLKNHDSCNTRLDLASHIRRSTTTLGGQGEDSAPETVGIV